MLQRSLARCPSTSTAGIEALRAQCGRAAAVATVDPSSSKRTYSTPTKRVNASAEATMTAPMTSPLPPPFVYKTPREKDVFPLSTSTLTAPRPLTILPGPLPDDPFAQRNQAIYPSPPITRSLAIIDACVYNLHDVPRAKRLFEELVEAAKHLSATEYPLDVMLFNTMLRAYADMAVKGRPEGWLPDVWNLYETMLDGPIQPNATTYAIIFATLDR